MKPGGITEGDSTEEGLPRGAASLALVAAWAYLETEVDRLNVGAVC